METIISILAVLTGLLMRLALPILITFVFVYLLRKLDARWQQEAQRDVPSANKPECWKINACSIEQRNDCPAFCSPLPCWQVYRKSNGYLNEKCLTCKVFIDAPTARPNIIQGEAKV